MRNWDTEKVNLDVDEEHPRKRGHRHHCTCSCVSKSSVGDAGGKMGMGH